MARTGVRVRPAVAADAAVLARLWGEYDTQRRLRLAPPTADEAERAVARIAVSSEESIWVAELAGEIVGAVHARRTSVSPLHDDDSVHVSHLFVLDEYRRRGAGRALLSAVAAWAEEKDVARALVAVPSMARSANRFLACLGVVPAATIRTAPMQLLRQRLNQSDSADVGHVPARQARRVLLRRRVHAGIGQVAQR